MKKVLNDILKSSCFILLLIGAFTYVNRVLILKGVEHGHYSPMSQYAGFYDMKENTIDVIFLGSSHCYCSFSPQELYNLYNIRSYNLGSSMQNVWLSYYWLEEALKYQTPKVLVLEAFMFSRAYSDEPYLHRALSFMRWSDSKIKALKITQEKHPELSILSFLFPNIRFHQRWKELTKEDFLYTGNSEDVNLKGYLPIGGKYGEDNYSALKPNSKEIQDMDDEIELYLNRIIELCRQRDIQIIFTKIPTTDWTIEEHNTYAEFAENNNINFIDYNIEDQYVELGYVFSEDSFDYGHANIWGAEKIARSLGGILVKEYGVPSLKDEQWEQSNEYVEAIKKEYKEATE